MKFFKAGLIACLALLTDAKKHYKVADNTLSKDHVMVKATSGQTENCMFQFENGDEFCLRQTSALSVGFRWNQDNQNPNYWSYQGYHNLDLIYYLRAYFQPDVNLYIQKLLKSQLSINWPQTDFSWVSGVHYNRYSNYLCLEVYSEISAFIMTVEQIFQFVQCSKTLVDCLNDFGQFWLDDRSTSTKPYSPYAKYFDTCDLSGQGTFTVQQYEPFQDDGDYTWVRQYRWVGSGAYDDGCFPGQLDYWIYQFEAMISTTAAPGPKPTYKGGMWGKLPEDHHKFEGGFLTNLVAPMLKSGIIQMIDNNTGHGESEFFKWKSM